ncbi:endolytic transglycosylase MltG [Aurantiacibacter zhengii]|uniref:Endolytic murein transglycosylase n=1 Tax=Aurantiacibacter zhengii TaxID=2307003 RepID=A0A418NQ81_9SPHN|nr:endolytic transglycosylase MltG [Aurantiacibacter zhengii]RIV84628.1 endolytic transglycosylase MltG [Aurantiacibacter zhengii]
MKKLLAAVVALGILAVAAVGGWFALGWYGGAEIDEETAFIVPSGATLTSVAGKLEEEGLIGSANGFLLRAKVLGSSDPIKAGEFLLTPGMSNAGVLDHLQHGEVIRRFVTIPEGTPSAIVHDILMAEPLLEGDIPVPEEGSVLPESYDFERGEERVAVLARMQRAMDEAIAELWPRRTDRTVAKTPEEAVTLASIVEKETGVPEERRMVAGLYSNRIRQGIFLQADPTIIYPITRGRPLGRRIRQSEIADINDYNTYQMAGLPAGPITNPGRASIEAVLNPAETDAIFMVADGSGGHEFNDTLQEHNEAVERWFALRRERGEM